MDREYRKALKMHLMKAFATNKSDYKEKNSKTTSPELVQALFDTPSVVSSSRIIDALIDTPVQSAREIYESYDTGFKYCQCNPEIDNSNNQEQQQNNMSSPSLPPGQRMKGGDNTNTGRSNGLESSQMNFSIFSYDSKNSSTRSHTPSFRKRTARELSNMVLAECELVESLNLIESERSQHKSAGHRSSELPIILWRSKKKKFNSSVDLCFSSTGSTKEQHKKPSQSAAPQPAASNEGTNRSQVQESLIDDAANYLDAEGIIREKFTAPLIRHVERNYVQNITATADLLKILERMPADIDRFLTKECNK